MMKDHERVGKAEHAVADTPQAALMAAINKLLEEKNV